MPTPVIKRYLFANPIQLPPSIGGAALGDNIAGLGLAFGVSLALFHREKTCKGQEIDISLLHTGLYQNTYFIAGVCSTGKAPEDWGTPPREKAPNPLILPYETKDGRWLVLAMPQSDRYWPQFITIMGKEELVTDPRYYTAEKRTENSESLVILLTDIFHSFTLTECKSRLNGVIPFSPYQTYLEAVNDPQVVINNMLVPFQHPKYGTMKVIENPVHLSETPATIRTAAPEIGQHSEEILLENGYSKKDIEQFQKRGVI